MSVPVLVVSSSISTALSVVRSLGAASYHVELFSIVKRKGGSKIVSSSKYLKASYECMRQDDEVIISRLKALKADDRRKWALFPIDDYCMSLLDRYSDSLKDIYYFPHIVGEGQGAITKRMDKSFQSRLASECGFLTPKEWVIPLGRDDLMIPEDVIYPCFVKPLSSIDGNKTEMGVCRNREELARKLRLLGKSNPDRDILVQEYLDISQEYSMSGVCQDQTVIIPAIVKKYKIARFKNGATLLGELVAMDEIGDVKDTIYRFLKRMHYAGMFDMEVMRVGDVFYFGELNLRSGGPNYSYFASGVNLPAAAVQIMCGEQPDPLPGIRLHNVFFHEQDGWEDYQHGYITRKELRGFYRQADILLIGNKDDPVPGKLYLRSVRVKKAKSIIKKLIGR